MVVWAQPVCGINPSSSLLGVNEAPDLPRASTYRLEPGRPSPGWPTLLRPPITQMPVWWYRNINLFSITYAFRPRLRDRLTLRRLALLRKPWVFGERVFHPLYRYSCQHGLFCPVQPSSQSTFNLNRMLPYRFLDESSNPAASVMCLSPVTSSAQTHSTSELLRFL